ncbi:MAG TPA: adenylate/guanylate cyclase domain-containing protein [Acidimicrobiales bacterium]|nr:adenylate/guanylate cyclase domain-containing protein [Acidimicrobiales bacterium]
MGTEVRYASAGDVHIAYRVVGERADASFVLWYPGAPLLPMEAIDEEPSLRRWQARLSTFCQVIEFDGRGIGLSDPTSPLTPPTLEQWVDDTIAVLDAVGAFEVDVIAPRDSSLEAIMLAAAHPDRVSKLVIINGAARMRRADDYPVGMPDRLVDRFLDTNTQPGAAGEGPDFLSFAAPTVADDPSFRAWWDRSGRRGASPAMARAVLEIGYRADVRPLLGLIRAPTLVLHRRDSQNIRVGHGRYLAEHIPDVRYVELAGQDCLYWVGDTDDMMDEVQEFLTGHRGGPDPERVLATVLFTDIVASTETLARIGERRWRDHLDRHDEVVRQELDRFGGRLVNTTGDGAVARFDGPARAVKCAASIRDRLADLGLSIRAGVHIGEIELRGADIAGMTVHIAARIQGVAQPGEVLMSRTVVDLIVGSGLATRPLGDVELKGVPMPVALFVLDDPSAST